MSESYTDLDMNLNELSRRFLSEINLLIGV
jgi:hypothetical protein